MDIDEVVSQHKDLVYHVINRIVFDANYHQDLFQETFLSIAKNFPTFQGRSKLSTWVYSVTAHTCLNHLRKLKSNRSYSLEEWL